MNDNQIATAIKHFDDARQMLATYGRGTLVTDEHYDGRLSLIEFYTFREAIEINK